MIENSKLGYYLMPVLKVWLYLFFLLLCTVPFGLIAQFEFLPSIPNPIVSDIVVQCSLVLVVLGALLMMFKVLPDVDFYDVYIKKQNSAKGFLKGVAFGFGIMVVCGTILYINGSVSFQKAAIPLEAVLLNLVYFFLIALFEEFLFRSYPLQAFSDRYPLWFAVLANGLLFAFAHLANPELSILGLTNIALAGVLFALHTIQKRNIAWAVGAHFAWNFTQAIILGYNLSGNKMSGFVKASPIGADFVSGGKFGIEGSVFCTLLLVVSIAWLVYKGKNASIEDGLAESEFEDN